MRLADAAGEWTEVHEGQFREVYDAYPGLKRDGVDKCRAAYAESGVVYKQAIGALKRLQVQIMQKSVEERFLPQLSAWLRNGAWRPVEDLTIPQVSEHDKAMIYYAETPNPVKALRLIGEAAAAHTARYGRNAKVEDDVRMGLARVLCLTDFDTNAVRWREELDGVPPAEGWDAWRQRLVAEWGDPDALAQGSADDDDAFVREMMTTTLMDLKRRKERESRQSGTGET